MALKAPFREEDLAAAVSSPAEGFVSELRRGWRPALGATLAMGVGTSLFLLTSGLFMKPLGAEFHWTRGQIGAAAFASVLGAVAIPVAGWLSDRFGPRRVGAFGMVVLASVFIGLSTMKGDILVFYGWRICVDVLGAAATAIVLTRPLAQAFDRHRGAALGLGLATAALMVMLIMPATQAVIAARGWRAGYLFLAALPAVIGLGALLLILPPMPEKTIASPPHSPSGVPLSAALRDRRFWLMFLAMLTANMCFGGLLGHLPALLGDRGMSPLTIGLVMSGLTGAAMFGRLTEGFLMDRLWAPAVACVTLLAPVAGLLLLLEPTASVPRAMAAVLLIGFAQGGEASQLSFFTARYFGFRAYGAIYGALAIGISLSLATGGTMFGFVFDRTGTYDVAILVAAAGLGVAALSMLATGLTPRTARRTGFDAADAEPVS